MVTLLTLGAVVIVAWLASGFLRTLFKAAYFSMADKVSGRNVEGDDLDAARERRQNEDD